MEPEPLKVTVTRQWHKNKLDLSPEVNGLYQWRYRAPILQNQPLDVFWEINVCSIVCTQPYKVVWTQQDFLKNILKLNQDSNPSDFEDNRTVM